MTMLGAPEISQSGKSEFKKKPSRKFDPKKM
jgi:hypothetical protein